MTEGMSLQSLDKPEEGKNEDRRQYYGYGKPRYPDSDYYRDSHYESEYPDYQRNNPFMEVFNLLEDGIEGAADVVHGQLVDASRFAFKIGEAAAEAGQVIGEEAFGEAVQQSVDAIDTLAGAVGDFVDAAANFTNAGADFSSNVAVQFADAASEAASKTAEIYGNVAAELGKDLGDITVNAAADFGKEADKLAEEIKDAAGYAPADFADAVNKELAEVSEYAAGLADELKTKAERWDGDDEREQHLPEKRGLHQPEERGLHLLGKCPCGKFCICGNNGFCKRRSGSGIGNCNKTWFNFGK